MIPVASVVNAAAARLRDAGLSRDEARRDTVVLARAVLGWSAADWLARSSTDTPATFQDALDALVTRRQRREPVAYLLGEKEFYGRTFRVNRHTLIPRPETEGLVDAALAWLRTRAGRLRTRTPGQAVDSGTPIRVLDIGTGTGCVAVTLALESPAVHVDIHATDICTAALDVARGNANRLGATAVTFHHGSLVADIAAPIDLVASNPPYVPAGDRQTLAPDVAEYEPHAALFAGIDGLDVIRQLIPAARHVLAPGGALLLEIGIGQADDVCDRLDTEGFVNLERRRDLQGIPRIIAGHVPAGL